LLSYDRLIYIYVSDRFLSKLTPRSQTLSVSSKTVFLKENFSMLVSWWTVVVSSKGWMGVNEIQSGKHNNFLSQRASFCRGIPMRTRTCIKPYANYDMNQDLNSITSVFSALLLSMFCVFHGITSSIQFWKAVGDRALFGGSRAILCRIYHQFAEKNLYFKNEWITRWALHILLLYITTLTELTFYILQGYCCL